MNRIQINRIIFKAQQRVVDNDSVNNLMYRITSAKTLQYPSSASDIPLFYHPPVLLYRVCDDRLCNAVNCVIYERLEIKGMIRDQQMMPCKNYCLDQIELSLTYMSRLSEKIDVDLILLSIMDIKGFIVEFMKGDMACEFFFVLLKF